MPADGRRSNERLANRTSFGIGGPAACVMELACEANAVRSAAPELRARDFFILGGGTNVLVADNGYDGIVVHFDGQPRIELLEPGYLRVSANASLDDVVSTACRHGLYGLELLAGIPGSIGGAVIQNAGAYKQQVADVIESVVCVNGVTGEIETRDLDACRMAYRTSIFKRSPESWFVVECTLRLSDSPAADSTSPEIVYELSSRGTSQGGIPSAQVISEAVRAVRARKDHLLSPTSQSAGSFFMNPRGTLSDRVIEAAIQEFTARRELLIACGADWVRPEAKITKENENDEVELVASLLIATATDPSDLSAAYRPGRTYGSLRLGAAGANTIVNAGGASASEVVALARQMREAVSEAYGVLLEPEVVLLGDISLD